MKRYYPSTPSALLALAAAAMTAITMVACVVLPASGDAIEQGAGALAAVRETLFAHKEKS